MWASKTFGRRRIWSFEYKKWSLDYELINFQTTSNNQNKIVPLWICNVLHHHIIFLYFLCVRVHIWSHSLLSFQTCKIQCFSLKLMIPLSYRNSLFQVWKSFSHRLLIKRTLFFKSNESGHSENISSYGINAGSCKGARGRLCAPCRSLSTHEPSGKLIVAKVKHVQEQQDNTVWTCGPSFVDVFHFKFPATSLPSIKWWL